MEPLPPHWSVTTGQVDDPVRGSVPLRIWGWSTRSVEDARRHAEENLAALIARGLPPARGARARRSEYYPRGPLREELLEEITAADGTLLAAVTRNRYGAEVLSTDAVVIADIDIPEPRRAGRGLFSRLFGGGPPPADPEEVAARERIAAFAAAHPAWGVLTFRTAAGFRVLVTGTGHRPSDPESTAILQELESDPLYVKLCQAHGTYRARLTPKPWRIGLQAPPVTWPTGGPGDETRYRDWIRTYDERSSAHDVCREEPSTAPALTEDERTIVELHARRTGVGGAKPLA